MTLNGTGCIDDIDFVHESVIGDSVFCDLNGNDVQEPSEPGIAGVTVNLLCAGPDGILGTADDTVDSEATDANGNYLFAGISSSPCMVSVDVTTVPGNKVPGVCPTTVTVNNQPGSSNLDADFCFENAVASMGDTVWCDTNATACSMRASPASPASR